MKCFNFRLAKLALLLGALVGCGYDSTTPYPPGPSVQDGLWTASASNPAILRLSPDQLLTTGDRVPATAITTPSADLFELNGIAFDTDGTLWVTSQDDSTSRFLPPLLVARAHTTPPS